MPSNVRSPISKISATVTDSANGPCASRILGRAAKIAMQQCNQYLERADARVSCVNQSRAPGASAYFRTSSHRRENARSERRSPLTNVPFVEPRSVSASIIDLNRRDYAIRWIDEKDLPSFRAQSPRRRR